MSHFILCKGNYQRLNFADIKVITYPFRDNYLVEASHYFWNDEIDNKSWWVINYRTCEIDSFFTNAQDQLSQNIVFSQTKLFSLLSSLLKCASEVVIWYSDYRDEIPVVSDKNKFLRSVEEQIKQPSCEVYIRYQSKCMI